MESHLGVDGKLEQARRTLAFSARLRRSLSGIVRVAPSRILWPARPSSRMPRTRPGRATARRSAGRSSAPSKRRLRLSLSIQALRRHVK
jgi:hypothetical protein